MKKKFKKIICLIAILCSVIIPANVWATEIQPKAPVCPAHDSGHIYNNSVYVTTTSTTDRHTHTLSDGALVSCTRVSTYDVYRKQCSCGYYTPSSTYRVLVNQTHSLN